MRGIFAGILKETDAGYSFAYDRGYLQSVSPSAVSLTLPLQEDEYTSKTLFAFFDGLIPEGWLLDIVSQNRKIDRKDRFGLLLVACKDPVGNVCIREERLCRYTDVFQRKRLRNAEKEPHWSGFGLFAFGYGTEKPLFAFFLFVPYAVLFGGYEKSRKRQAPFGL